MPYINLRIGTRLTTAQRAELCRRSTSLMHSVMAKKREVTAVHIQQSDPGDWSVDGTRLSSGQPTAAYVDIKVTEGTNSADQKASMIALTVEMLEDVVGTLQQASYVVVDEVRADSWGYNGRTQASRATAISDSGSSG